MPAAFFWLVIFPMLLGGALLTIFIIILKRKSPKFANPESKRITPTEFINEVAQYSDIDKAEAERIIEFVFSYFPEFNWRNKLPRVKDREMYEDNEEKTKKS
jgi:hypothetical protein